MLLLSRYFETMSESSSIVELLSIVDDIPSVGPTSVSGRLDPGKNWITSVSCARVFVNVNELISFNL